MISKKDEELFFKELKAIRLHHAKFLSGLRNQQEKNGMVEKIDERFFGNLADYRNYVKLNNNRIERFEKLLKDDSFNKFFSNCWRKMSKSNVSISNYFNLPIYHLNNLYGSLKVTFSSLFFFY